MKRICGFLAVVVALLFLVAPGQAMATHVSCGQTITTDTKLDSDLIDCSGDGIVIGADDIALDLAGHTIDGINSAPSSSAGVGVLNRDYDRLRIERGTIREFATGMRLGSRTTLGEPPNVAADNVVRGLTVSETATSVLLATAHDTVIEHNVLLGRTGVENAGRFDFADTVLIQNNDISVTGSHNPPPPNPFFGPAAISMGRGSNAISVIGNRITLSGDAAGLYLSFSGPSLIGRNVITGAAYGISVSKGTRARIVKNRVSDSIVDGIRVNDLADAELVGNVMAENGDDGIEVDYAAPTLTRNTANDNGDLGIEASERTIDGGGNKASGNGNPLQCLNVFCK
jgi:parallel beta-helix repeat protein